MSFLNRPSVPPAPVIPPLIAPPTRANSAEIRAAAAKERRRRALAQGRTSTVLGGQSGPPGTAQKKTLLGE